jgi:hypothetical protein
MCRCGLPTARRQVLTVFRQLKSEQKYLEDTQWVRRDLEALKALLEK